MADICTTLKKVLQLEEQKGFSDTAVAGGFQNFVNFLYSEDAIEQITRDNREQMEGFFRSYSSQNIAERQQVVKMILRWIDSGSEGNLLSLEGSNEIPHENLQSIETQKITTKQDPALFAEVQTLWGIGEKNKKIFNKLGIYRVYDLLRYFPRRYQDFSHLRPINEIMYGEEITVIGSISQKLSTRRSKRSNLQITETAISDNTGYLRLTWFNQPYLERQLHLGDPIVVSGKVDAYLGRLVMNSPEWEHWDSDQLHTNRIVPMYPLTFGISQRQIRKIIHHNLEFWSQRVLEYLPSSLTERLGLPGISTAINEIHFPNSEDSLRSAQKRFATEEIFFLQMGVLLQRQNWVQKKAERFSLLEEHFDAAIRSLPYQLTDAQLRAIAQIRRDLSSGTPMNRLLQGDVGSGKTVVSRFAIEAVVRNGAQSAVMAPTSILAEQHFQTLSQMLVTSQTIKQEEIALLIGSTSQKERKLILSGLKAGKINVLIGTHALIEDPVAFKDLALVVIDEQHRFGVEQRAALRKKGDSPHLLVMTATPIPRSLALTIYGDLDISTIDEMPKGRLPVETKILHPEARASAYALIHSQVESGNQAFIVYPQIENEDAEDFKAAVNEYERLSKVFPDLKIGLIHGELNPTEKDEIMLKFRNREFDILVSTTVIEVGVDIPKATVVLIEGANRFGLAQLHQIRGRVGRNKEQSFCILIPDSEDALNNKRLNAMVTTNDGFVLADLDLKYRGPGEFLGTRQSGLIRFKFASVTDQDLIEVCRKEVEKIIVRDSTLEAEEHQLLKSELFNYWPALK